MLYRRSAIRLSSKRYARKLNRIEILLLHGCRRGLDTVERQHSRFDVFVLQQICTLSLYSILRAWIRRCGTRLPKATMLSPILSRPTPTALLLCLLAMQTGSNVPKHREPLPWLLSTTSSLVAPTRPSLVHHAPLHRSILHSVAYLETRSLRLCVEVPD